MEVEESRQNESRNRRSLRKLDALDWLIDLAKEHTKDKPHARKVGCTGLFAGWCPLCGSCNCSQSDVVFNDWCPLHGDDAERINKATYPETHYVDYEDDPDRRALWDF